MDAALCMQDLGYIFLVTSFSVNSLTTFLPTEKFVKDFWHSGLMTWLWATLKSGIGFRLASFTVQQYSSTVLQLIDKEAE